MSMYPFEIKGTVRRGVAVRAGLAGAVLILGGVAAPSALGYGYYQFGNGRADFTNRYDAPGTLWAGQANATYFSFGSAWDFSAADRGQANFPAFLSTANVNTALNSAASEWEKWINITVNNNTVANGTGAGNIRLVFDTAGTFAYALGYQHTGAAQTWAEIHFPATASGGTPWNATNFEWTLRHEMGHVLGLDDLYPYVPETRTNLPEDFVDHTVPPTTNPQREYASLQDNLMFQINQGNNYANAPITTIDNDEIAGVAWLWGSKYNQIVTGELGAFDAAARRGSTPHHGDQGGAQNKTWDYRVSFSSDSSTSKPYVDLDFAGYQSFVATSYPGVTVNESASPLGGNYHRFTVDQAGFNGNLVLSVTSSFSAERRIFAYVNGGGRTDNFVLPVNLQGLTFNGANDWAVPFGPMGNAPMQDFGDAPDSYKTLLASNGPRYTEGTSQHFGSRFDVEPDGQPTRAANGDDANLWGYGGVDDEDGVFFGTDSVTISFYTDRINPEWFSIRGWWDLNNNGQFDHATELFVDNEFQSSGPGDYSFLFDNLGFDPHDYYSRFRLTWLDNVAGGLFLGTDILPFGEYLNADGVSHGEVEDYVPEPASLSLLALGSLILARRNRK
ncbi:MAG: PEP-CTERM sorting domain-containing protein [Planctomycetes bacterium]|nr:PEP-CTERM sorting domain-containing protein [Planctomycetota bacterium]